MLILVVILLAGAALSGRAADAQTSTPPSSARPSDPALGKLLDQYATIAGGWHLEARCNYFAQNLKREFEWNVAQTTIGLSRAVAQPVLLTIQQGAKSAADARSCNAETESIVMQTLTLSRRTAHALTGRSYDSEAQRKYTAERIHRLLLAQAADGHCTMMPADVRAAFDTRVNQVVTKFEQEAGSQVVKEIQAAAASTFAKAPPGCDNRMREFLQAMTAEARQLAGQ